MRDQPPEADEVVLLSPAGTVVGSAARLTVHTGDTPLHLAFSCYVFDADGRVLMTRRALGKRTWPGVWTNTCCGHPRPGEDMTAAIRRRLDDELGLAVGELSCVLPDFAYAATDASGVMENEICPVFRADLMHPSGSITPNADEVMDWTWVDWNALVGGVGSTPFAFSPWSVLQLAQLAQLDHNGLRGR